jgi:DNA-binding transcriptional MerR regulator
MIVNSGLDKMVEYLNDKGLSIEELAEIIDLRRDPSVLNILKKV